MRTGDQKQQELWHHWARMPAWSHHEVSALVAGIVPSKKWDYNSLSRGYYSFGEEMNTRYFRIWDLLLREKTMYRISFPIELPDLLDWAKRSQIELSPNFLIALLDLNRLPLQEQNKVSDDSSGETLGTRERETLLYLIGTIAVCKYGFTPKKRNTAAAEIHKDMAKIGLEALSSDTIRNKLKEASDLIPQSYFSEFKKDR